MRCNPACKICVKQSGCRAQPLSYRSVRYRTKYFMFLGYIRNKLPLLCSGPLIKKKGGDMCSKSFLARWEMYFKAKGEAQKEVKAELPLNSQIEQSEIDSPIVEVSKIEDVKSRS